MERQRVLAVVDVKKCSVYDELQASDYEVRFAHTLRPALHLIKEFDPDIIILDLDTNTFGKAKRIIQTARRHPKRPFIVLTKSSRSAPDPSFFYDALLFKPFVFPMLQDTLERLKEERLRYVIQLPPFILDRRTLVLQGPQGVVRLNPNLTRLMAVFMLHPREPLHHKRLIREVWQVEGEGDIRTLHVHIHWLRKLIERHPSQPQFIKTLRGRQSYLLDVEGEPHIGGGPLLPPSTSSVPPS